MQEATVLDNIEIRSCSCGRQFVVVVEEGKKNTRSKCGVCSASKGRNRCNFCGKVIEGKGKEPFCNSDCYENYLTVTEQKDNAPHTFIMAEDNNKNEELMNELHRELRLFGFNTMEPTIRDRFRVLTLGSTDLTLLGDLLGRYGIFEWSVEIDEWSKNDVTFRITTVVLT